MQANENRKPQSTGLVRWQDGQPHKNYSDFSVKSALWVAPPCPFLGKILKSYQFLP